jgi:hypothetical protein
VCLAEWVVVQSRGVALPSTVRLPRHEVLARPALGTAARSCAGGGNSTGSGLGLIRAPSLPTASMVSPLTTCSRNWPPALPKPRPINKPGSSSALIWTALVAHRPYSGRKWKSPKHASVSACFTIFNGGTSVKGDPRFVNYLTDR